MEFKELQLHEDLQRGLDEAGFVTCMPVQAEVFEHSLSGEDIYAQSQTGTGKTAAFLVTIFNRVMTVPEVRKRKSLILAPTRELAVQIEEEAKKLGKHVPISTGAFYGGVSYGPQVDMLRDDVQVIIGTPGRIIDLVQQGKMLLKDVGFLVIDEADRMFDMGFIDDLRKLIRYLPPPGERQTFLFSATLNVRVKNLAWEYMDEPKEIVIEPERVTVELVTQELYHVGSDEKLALLLGLIKRDKPESALIFCNQKFMAEEVARRLKLNGIECEFIMGDLPQKQRSAVIEKLKAGQISILVATDVAARGLDVESLDLVVNYDVPLDPESYVHRIGRTARAGKSGKAVTLACEKFVYGLPAIEKYLGVHIPVLPFTEDLLVEDKSGGMRFSHRHEEGRREHGSRDRDHGRGGLDRSGRSRRPEKSGGRAPKPLERGNYRKPQALGGISSIQRSIAEAAGRAMDQGPEEIKAVKRAQSTERKNDGRKAGGQGGAQKGSQAAKPQGQDRNRGGDSARRSEARTQAAPAASGGNPYDMPMEERMKLYKQRYADSGAGQNGQGQGGQARNQGQGRGQGAQRQAAQPKEGSGQRGKGDDKRRDGRGPSQGRRDAAPPRREAPAKSQAAKPAASPQGAGPKNGAKKPGLLDRLKSIFGGKDKE
jgi:ATP-dependent RNA helicase RhlB